MDAAIEVDSVSKQFRLSRDAARSFKERFIRLNRGSYEEFWALRDVSFNVQHGETLGVLGHNGSGKSTLLKCIAGILLPTTGEIRTRGMIAALLELGAGFHPDLTGRENVYINGALLGLSKRETERRFDDIVAFAELEDFIDQQVKYYSSGMYVRLGFAVAINVEPDILLIDEVLAVGDEAFSRKCLAKIREFQEQGRTIVFVTHAVDLAREICNRIVVLDHGHMIADGEPGPAIRAYRDHLFASGRELEIVGLLDDTGFDLPREPRTEPEVRITSVRVHHPHAPDRDHLLAFESVAVEVEYHARSATDAVVGLGIYNEKGERLWGVNTQEAGFELGTLLGTGTVSFRIGSVPLLDGNYNLQIGITDPHGIVIDWIDSMSGFRVLQLDKTVGMVAMPFEIDHRFRRGASVSAPP